MTDDDGYREWAAEQDAAVIPFPLGQFDRSHNRHEATLDSLPVRTTYGVNTCRHERSTVDAAARTVSCRDCGTALDPIEALERLARNREALVGQGVSLRREVESLREEVAKLKREEKNAKARVRNASNPAAKQARTTLAKTARTLGQVSYALIRMKWSEDYPLLKELRELEHECDKAAAGLAPAKMAASS